MAHEMSFYKVICASHAVIHKGRSIVEILTYPDFYGSEYSVHCSNIYELQRAMSLFFLCSLQSACFIYIFTEPSEPLNFEELKAGSKSPPKSLRPCAGDAYLLFQVCPALFGATDVPFQFIQLILDTVSQ